MSVLEPVLFLLLTNDMPGWIAEAGHNVIYAEITVLILAYKTTGMLEEETQPSQFSTERNHIATPKI